MNLQHHIKLVLAKPHYAGIYEVLWRKGQLTRRQLAYITNMSAPTVARIVADLIKIGLLLELPANEPISSGRPATKVAINPHAGYMIGIDLGGTKAAGALLTLNNEILADKTIAVAKESIPEIASSLADMVEDMLAEAQVERSAVIGVGIGVPSSVDLSRTTILDASNLKVTDWHIVTDMVERLQMPVFVENDANAAAMAQYYFTGQDDKNMAYISLGTGIGMGLIINGQLFVGSLGNAGELGHIVAVPEGPRCTCGNKGCLEAMASGWAVARAYTTEKRIGAANYNSLAEITCEDVFGLAENGDEVARDVLDRAAYLIGLAIDGVINTLSISRFVLGGSMALNYPHFVSNIERSALENAPSEYTDMISITCTTLRNAGVLGAGSLVMQDLLYGAANLRENSSGSYHTGRSQHLCSAASDAITIG